MSEAISQVGVVGAGTMGSGIAQKMAMEGRRVVLCDLGQAQLDAGLGRIRKILDEGKERGLMTAARAEETLGRIVLATDLCALSECPLVIEAVFEDLTIKKELFAALDRACPYPAILATNTSSFLVADVAQGVSRPERILGLHFFYHPVKNKLVEVIAGPASEPALVKPAWDLMEATGKVPIAVKDSPGFCVNRFFIPWFNEAVRILDEGAASLEDIEATAKDAFGIGMGPFELMNITGLSVAHHATEGLRRRLGDFCAPARGLVARFRSGQPWDLSKAPSGTIRPEVAESLFAVAWFVAGEILEQKVAAKKDVDLGAKVGLRWRLGPFELMEEAGMARVTSAIARLAERHPGVRIAPCLKSLEGDGPPPKGTR